MGMVLLYPAHTLPIAMLRKDQASMNMEERGGFYRRGRGSPKGVCVAPRRNSPPLHGGNPLFMVVTPSST
jgi:hypothetical protein